jgi:hypothetical protein
MSRAATAAGFASVVVLVGLLGAPPVPVAIGVLCTVGWLWLSKRAPRSR